MNTDSISFRYRNSCKLLTLSNPPGEPSGYLTGALFLLPDVEDPSQREAAAKRTRFLLQDPDMFKLQLEMDILKLNIVAVAEALKPAIRLNGMGDLMWERFTFIQDFPQFQFYDYSAIPFHLRRPPANYHLTFCVERSTVTMAIDYLEKGRSVAAIVPDDVKACLLAAQDAGRKFRFPMVDGDANDLRFLDRPGTLALLKPKGWAKSRMLMPSVIDCLEAA